MTRNDPQAPAVRSILQARWDAAGEPATGWVWPATCAQLPTVKIAKPPTKSGHVESNSLKRAHRRALALSGVAPFPIYALRHTRLTEVAPYVDGFTLMKMAGHTSPVMTSRYVHPSAKRVLDALLVCDGDKIRDNPELQIPMQSGRLN
jgi:integrase